MKGARSVLAVALAAAVLCGAQAAEADASRRRSAASADLGASAGAQRHGFGPKQERSFSVPLVKGTLDKQTRTALLQELRWAQHGLWNEEEDQRPIYVQRQSHSDAVPRRFQRHSEQAVRAAHNPASLRARTARQTAAQGQLRGGLSEDALGPRFAHAQAGARAGFSTWLSKTASSAVQGFRELAGGWAQEAHHDGEDVTLKAQILTRKRLATYYGRVTLGSGAATKDFDLLFDTGSCEFWVPSKDCKDPVCELHAKFDASANEDDRSPSERNLGSTGNPLPANMVINYLSGGVKGPLRQARLKIGNLVVEYQTVGVAEEIDVPLLMQVKWGGIMGLAYPNSDLSREGVSPVFDTIINDRLLHRNVFGYFIGPTGGMVTFGDIDTDYIVDGETLQWAAVINRGYWTLGLKNVELSYPDGQKYATNVCDSEADGMCRAIVDTGTYLMYGPEDMVQQELRDVQTSSCSLLATMPSVTLVLFGGADNPDVRVTMTPEDYALIFRVPAAGVPEEECNKLAAEHPDADDVESSRCIKECVSGIAPDKDSIWTLGQVLLRTHYTVFDRDHDRVGFARSTHEKNGKTVGTDHGHSADKGHPDGEEEEQDKADEDAEDKDEEEEEEEEEEKAAAKKKAEEEAAKKKAEEEAAKKKAEEEAAKKKAEEEAAKKKAEEEAAKQSVERNTDTKFVGVSSTASSRASHKHGHKAGAGSHHKHAQKAAVASKAASKTLHKAHHKAAQEPEMEAMPTTEEEAIAAEQALERASEAQAADDAQANPMMMGGDLYGFSNPAPVLGDAGMGLTEDEISDAVGGYMQ
ncbi:hypothetical protein FNF28_00809 [Cafeteria roenbergensis]|uniref:Peptidase A1 domain-containing protein n=1 Tax=Cafeteria roenbergensis TaxID=33653 RepID=A0A5A8E1V4_CAFRO|nr:hypothetical protein FNF28_00809 [Cafeteria roenbergensis]